MSDALSFKAGRIKGNLERLGVEIEKEHIDRLKCRAILTEIQAAYEKKQLNENWRVADIFLSTLEIAVRRARSRLNLDVGIDKEDFVGKFKELAAALETRGILLSSLEQQLPSSFWRVRNDVIRGVCPDEQELELLVTWIQRLTATTLEAL